MADHLVCLTFDFDAVSPWINRGETTPTALSRGEFGVVGARRLLTLLERSGIRATWFIPGHTIDTYFEVCAAVHRAGHEIGHHGYLHEPPATLAGRSEEATVLDRGLECIRRLTGGAPAGYRSPSWDLSEHTVDLLLERGFRYDSSLMGQDDQPYRCRTGDVATRDGPMRFGVETELWEMPISWSLDDHPQFEYVRRSGFLQPGLAWTGGVLENWLDDFRYMARETERGVLTYTMHPQVIGRGHRLLMLERLVAGLVELGARFVRMDEALELMQGGTSSPLPEPPS
ncbi:MAG TPA: polysaccharide deacetylase [Candidatus Dormibacteraeota bacterium]|nr:polysaccharide deacetylase [Candidatus Dormibacteraeota bacterium]